MENVFSVREKWNCSKGSPVFPVGTSRLVSRVLIASPGNLYQFKALVFCTHRVISSEPPYIHIATLYSRNSQALIYSNHVLLDHSNKLRHRDTLLHNSNSHKH